MSSLSVPSRSRKTAGFIGAPLVGRGVLLLDRRRAVPRNEGRFLFGFRPLFRLGAVGPRGGRFGRGGRVLFGVIGDVPSIPLELDRGGRNELLERAAALLALRRRLVRGADQDFDDAPALFASVFVERHQSARFLGTKVLDKTSIIAKARHISKMPRLRDHPPSLR